MAFMRYANAMVCQTQVSQRGWGRVRKTAGGPSRNIMAQASEILGQRLDPDKFLLTHSTIVASVDVDSVPNVKLGRVKVGKSGRTINRKYSDYYIQPQCSAYVNNNGDSWSRPVLTASYPTFIGGHNFLEHVQLEEQSKGRIIDAVLRDIGDSLYTDILVATDRRHTQLITDIEEERLSTLSMGCSVETTTCTKCGNVAVDEPDLCFPPGTRVLLVDGTYRPIEEVVSGDLVITHTGATKPVLHTMNREYKGHLTTLNITGVPNPLRSTPNHPYWVLRPAQICGCGCGESLDRTVEHERGSVNAFRRRFRRGHNTRLRNPNHLAENVVSLSDYEKVFDIDFEFIRADEIHPGDYVAYPIPKGVENTPDATEAKARLIGYFLAEGCFIKRDGRRVGVAFSFGFHDYETLAVEVMNLLDAEFGRCERRESTGDWQALVAEGNISPIRRRCNSRPVSQNIECPSCGAPSDYAYNARFKPGRDDCYTCKVCGRNWVAGADRSTKACRYPLGGPPSEGDTLVQFLSEEAAEFFFRYCGEYADGKILPTEVMQWDPEVQRHVLLTWLGGDGTQNVTGVRGNSASFHLICQMHMLAARCDLYSYRNVVFNGKAATLDQVVNGDGSVTVRDDRGWLPSFSLTISEPVGFDGEIRFTDRETARVSMRSLCDGFKRIGDWLIYRVRDVWSENYSGKVHNLEVEGDHSYVVDGVAVHNCPCIKYEKLNKFIDEQGIQRIVAELCFPPGTRVTLGGGSRVAIDDIQVGDIILSHLGNRREVVETFERDYQGDLVALDLVGIPQTLRSTPNHPYWVISQNDICACGCGVPLKSVRKIFDRGEYLRKYAPGHNPANVVSLEPPAFDFKEAGDIQVGDMVAMPVPEGVVVPEDVDETRARLLGWFLAEGSYLKKHGERVGLQFTLNADDEIGVANMLARLLAEAFPPEFNQKREFCLRVLNLLSDAPATVRQVAEATGSKISTVWAALKGLRDLEWVESRRLTADEKDVLGAVNTNTLLWKKVGDPDLREWSCQPRVHLYDRTTEEGQKLVVCYVNRVAAEWFFRHAGEYAGDKKLSGDAIFWPRDIQATMLRAYLQGDGTVDRQMRHEVSSVSETLISQMQIVAARCGFWTRRQVVFEGQCVELAEVVNGSPVPVGSDGFRPRHELHIQPSDEATAFFGIVDDPPERGLSPAWRSHGGCMLYRVRKLWRESYSGKVYNIAVNHDHSYLAEGIAVHNCGHPSLDPHAGVQFIEASWVATPAFTGAVLRNILQPSQVPESVARQIQAMLNTPPPQWDSSQRSVAASLTRRAFEFGDEPDEPEESGEAKPEEPAKSKLDELADKIEEAVTTKVQERIEEELQKRDVGEALTPEDSTMAPNDTIIKEGYHNVVTGLLKNASSEIEFVDRFAAVNQAFGIQIPRHVYRVALEVGPLSRYPSIRHFLEACQHVSGGNVTPADVRTLVRIGKMLTKVGSQTLRLRQGD